MHLDPVLIITLGFVLLALITVFGVVAIIAILHDKWMKFRAKTDLADFEAEIGEDSPPQSVHDADDRPQRSPTRAQRGKVASR